MKVESGIKPKNKFIIDNIKGNKCDVVFFDDVKEEKRKKDNDEEQVIFTYNTYKISLTFRENLQDSIEKDITEWLDYAKRLDYENKATEIRKLRNKLLEESDKEMVIDRLNLEMPDNISATTILSVIKKFFEDLSTIKNNKWAKYRQELRDITKQEGFPYNIEFPVKPEE